jgi:hypothetical protein
MAAARTLIDVTAERSTTAALDRPQHTDMLPAQPRSILLDKAFACRTKDIGHLEGWRSPHEGRGGQLAFDSTLS